MQYTHKQIVLKFKEWFESHHFVQRYTYGDYESSQIDKSYPFPHVHLEPVSVTFGDTIGYTFDLTIRDLERVEEVKQQHIEQILSDTLQIIQDFQAYIAKGDDFFDRNLLDFTSSAASARWDSETQTVAGWQMTFTINVPNDYDICSIPLGDATPEPPADCNPATLVDSEGNTLREIASGATFTINGYRISSSSGAQSSPVTAISAGGIVTGATLEEIVILFNGSGDPAAIAQDIVDGADAELETEIANLVCTPCADATITDNASNELFTVASGGTQRIDLVRIDGGVADQPIYPIVTGWQDVNRAITGTTFTLQDIVQGFSDKGTNEDVYAQDIVDGSSATLQTELSNLLCGTTEIIPALVRPLLPSQSYRDYDLGWQWDNAILDRLNSDRTGRVRVLGADVYTLDANTLNEFGTTARFTFDNGDNAWNGTSFDTTYPVGATDYVIIDHLTHLVWYVANLGQKNWNEAVDDAYAHSAGGFTWRIPSENEFQSVHLDTENAYYSGGNMFRRDVESGYTEIYAWTGQTRGTSTSNAIRIGTTFIPGSRAKTDSNLNSVYPVANYTP